MVVLDGVKVPVSSITRIEGMYVFTSDYMKICITDEEKKEILKKLSEL